MHFPEEDMPFTSDDANSEPTENAADLALNYTMTRTEKDQDHQRHILRELERVNRLLH